MNEKKLAEELVDQLMNRTEELGAEENIENPDYEFRPVPTQVLYDTEKRAMARARDLGLEGVHIHEMEGREMYMPGTTHEDWLNALKRTESLQEDYKFSEGDKVKWSSAGGTARGVVRDRTNDSCYDAAIDGDVKVCGEEDSPAYLIEIFDDELTGTMVAHKESTLSSASFEMMSLSEVSEDLTGFSLSHNIVNADVELEEDDSLDEVYSEWDEHVNMTASELEQWSNNPCSREASKDPEAVIKRNLRLLTKNKDDWTENDIKDAKRTISFISRMRANEPDEPRDGPHGCPSEWAISLLNWAFNPFNSVPDIPDDDDLDDVEKITMRQADTFFDAAKAQGERDEELSDDEVSVEVEPSVIHEVGDEKELQESDSFFRTNWRRLFDSDVGDFSYQVFWRGLTREQKDLTHEELLGTEDVNMVGSLRFTFDNVDSSGLTVFESRSDVDEGFVSEVVEHSDQRNANERLESVWKGWELKKFMDTGFEEPKLFRPSGDRDSWGKMFGVDRGTVEVGVVHRNSAELFFKGDKLNGRAMVTRVPAGSWMLSFPENQTPMAKQVSLEKKVSELKESSVDHTHLIWNDPESEDPMRTISIKDFGSEEMREETVDVHDFDSLVDELWS